MSRSFFLCHLFIARMTFALGSGTGRTICKLRFGLSSEVLWKVIELPTHTETRLVVRSSRTARQGRT